VATFNADLNRREALRRLAIGAVGAATSPMWPDSLIALAREHAQAHAASGAIAAPQWSPKVLSTHQNDTVVALAELIIPETDTPGAKAANVNRFIDWVLFEALPADREKFMSGLTWIDERSTARYQKDFMSASGEQQTALLVPFADETNHAADANERKRVSHASGAGPGAPASERVGGTGGAKPPGLEDATGVTFFQAIKSMTISGYYSTQIGLQQELGDDGVMVNGVFKGCDHPEHQA